MLYAIRNDEGRITGLTETAQDGAEPIALKSPEVLDFLSDGNDDFQPDDYLNKSDNSVSRILEDLIDLLITKDVIMFTELPNVAQQKLLNRKLARRILNDDEAPEIEPTSILSDDSSVI